MRADTPRRSVCRAVLRAPRSRSTLSSRSASCAPVRPRRSRRAVRRTCTGRPRGSRAASIRRRAEAIPVLTGRSWTLEQVDLAKRMFLVRHAPRVNHAHVIDKPLQCSCSNTRTTTSPVIASLCWNSAASRRIDSTQRTIVTLTLPACDPRGQTHGLAKEHAERGIWAGSARAGDHGPTVAPIGGEHIHRTAPRRWLILT